MVLLPGNGCFFYGVFERGAGLLRVFNFSNEIFETGEKIDHPFNCNKMTTKTFQIAILLLFVTSAGCNKSKQNDEQPRLNCLPAGLQGGVIALYSFTGGSISDYSGNNYDLTNTSTASPGTDRAGNPRCAFNFAAANGDFLKFANPTFTDNFQTAPFSISLWYRNLTTTASNYELLIGRDINLHCPDTYGQWSVGLYDLRKPVLGINEYSLWWNNPARPDTLWKHLVVTCEGIDLKLYLNGVLSLETPGTGCVGNSPTLNTGDLFIGKNYTGLLDDVVIYNRVLAPAEITQLTHLSACCQ